MRGVVVTMPAGQGAATLTRDLLRQLLLLARHPLGHSHDASIPNDARWLKDSEMSLRYVP